MGWRRSSDKLEWYMHALELAGVGAWSWDIRTGEVLWTSYVAPLLGLKPGEYTPSYETFLSRVHIDDRAPISDAIKAALSQGAVYDVEYRVTNLDGKVRWMTSQGSVIRDESGNPQRMLGIISDVTDQHNVTQEKARNCSWMQVIHEAGILVNASLEGVGDFKSVIAALRKLIAIDHFMIVLVECDEAVFAVVDTTPGKYSRIKPGTRFPLSGSFVEQLGREGRPRIIDDLAQSPAFPENRLIAGDGMRSCVRLPLLHGDVFLGMLAIASHQPHAFDPASLPYLESLALQVAHTVANIRRYQQAKSDADRLATIVREVHHRIKNNLQGVIGLLDRHREEQPALAPVLTRAVSQLHAVAEVHNLLSHHTRETVRLRELVDGVCRAATTLCPHRIDPESTPTAESLTVSASEAVPIALVLNELIQNAINHGYPDDRCGTIRVTLAATPGGARLQVLDDGIGPPSGFDSDTGAGFGVGLNLVRALLPAKGASFRLTRRDGWTVAEVVYTGAAAVILPTGNTGKGKGI